VNQRSFSLKIFGRLRPAPLPALPCQPGLAFEMYRLLLELQRTQDVNEVVSALFASRIIEGSLPRSIEHSCLAADVVRLIRIGEH
jgi:hypothetical protein